MSTNKHKKKPAGVTLIELTIAISIFSIVMLIALDSFLSVLKFNREAVQKQSIQDHSEFLFSLMSKEIRMAKINYAGSESCDNYFQGLTPSVSVEPNDTYVVVANNEELRFQNYEGLCVRYFIKYDEALDSKRLIVERHNPTSDLIGDFVPGDPPRTAWVLPGDIKVADLYFEVKNMFDNHPTGFTQPPAVKYSIRLVSSIWSPSEMRLFNIITGRNFEQF